MDRILIMVHPKWFGTKPTCKNCPVKPILVQKLEITRLLSSTSIKLKGLLHHNH